LIVSSKAFYMNAHLQVKHTFYSELDADLYLIYI
jgi:hypothetical protein